MIRGKDIKWILSMFIVSVIGLNFLITKDFKLEFSDVTVFISIGLGFKITSLSILFNSKVLNKLYDTQNKIYQTELHKLKEYFKFSVYLDLCLILFSILIVDFNKTFVFLGEIYFFISKSSLVICLIILSIYKFSLIFNLLMKVFVYPRNE